MNIVTKKNTLILLTVLLAGSFLIFSHISGIPSQEVAKAYELKDFITQFGPLGPIALIALMVIANVLAPFSGAPFFIAAVFVYKEMAAVYFFVASVLSFTINFAIARIWGRGIVKYLVGEKNIEKIDKFSNKYGLAMLLILRLSQVPVQDFLSYAAGFTTISLRSYLVVSTLGIVPFTIALYLVLAKTDALQDFLYSYVAWAIVAFGIYMLLIYLKKHKKYKNVPITLF